MGSSATWTNWVGNQTCSPAQIARPTSEDEAIAAVRAALAAGRQVRVAATGHSFTPVCLTDGALIELAGVSGLLDVDAEGRATALAGTTVEDLGEPLWAAGLALGNQGDIDEQQLAGAVSTGTHGSGASLRSFSGTVTALRLVTASGDVLDIDGTRPDLLHAAQVAVGMLGVITRLQIQAVPAYRLRERIEHHAFEDVMARWDERVAAHRHFSFFWLPTEGSAALYNLEPPASGAPLADSCYVKIYDAVGPDVPDDATPDARVDRSYRIYPGEFDPNFHELEYFVPLERGPDAVRAMRELMLARQPAAVFPMEVRTMAADEAWLSGAHGGPAAVISISGMPGTDYWPYLREVDALLGTFGARVHWGKLHLLTRAALLERYPRAEDFIRVRRELDPEGRFLNDHLRPLFA